MALQGGYRETDDLGDMGYGRAAHLYTVVTALNGQSGFAFTVPMGNYESSLLIIL
jgi:hypothetical protein